MSVEAGVVQGMQRQEFIAPQEGVIGRGEGSFFSRVKQAAKRVIDNRETIAINALENLKESAPEIAVGAGTRIAIKAIGTTVVGAPVVAAAMGAASAGAGIRRGLRERRRFEEEGFTGSYTHHVIKYEQAQARPEQETQIPDCGFFPRIKKLARTVLSGMEATVVKKAYSVEKRQETTGAIYEAGRDLEVTSNNLTARYTSAENPQKTALGEATDAFIAYSIATERETRNENFRALKQTIRASRALSASADNPATAEEEVSSAMREAVRRDGRKAVIGLGAVAAVKAPFKFIAGAGIAEAGVRVASGIGQALGWTKDTLGDALMPTAAYAEELTATRQEAKETVQSAARQVVHDRAQEITVQPPVPPVHEHEQIQLTVERGSSISKTLQDAGIIDDFNDQGSGDKFVDAVADNAVESGKMDMIDATELKKAITGNPEISLVQLYNEHGRAFHDLNQVNAGEEITVTRDLTPPLNIPEPVQRVVETMPDRVVPVVTEVIPNEQVGQAIQGIVSSNDVPAAVHQETFVGDIVDKAVTASNDFAEATGNFQEQVTNTVNNVVKGAEEELHSLERGIEDIKRAFFPVAAATEVKTEVTNTVVDLAPANSVSETARDFVGETRSFWKENLGFTPEEAKGSITFSTDHPEIFAFDKTVPVHFNNIQGQADHLAELLKSGETDPAKLAVLEEAITTAPNSVSYFEDPFHGGVVLLAHSGNDRDFGQLLMEEGRRDIEGGPWDYPRFAQDQIDQHLIDLETTGPQIILRDDSFSGASFDLYGVDLQDRAEVLAGFNDNVSAPFFGQGPDTLTITFCGRSAVDALKIFDDPDLQANMPARLKNLVREVLHKPGASGEEVDKAVKELMNWLKLHDPKMYDEFRWQFDGYKQPSEEIKAHVPDFYSWTRYILRFRAGRGAEQLAMR